MALLFSSKLRRRKSDSAQSGQALLIVLLVMAVALTVVLSTASRSVTDIQTTSLEDDSLRAFSAAEAGIEEALLDNSSVSPSTLNNNATYQVDYDDDDELDVLNFPFNYYSGDTATIWFVRHQENGDITCSGGGCATARRMRLCWGDPGTSPVSSETPAVEVTLYYDNTYQAVSAQNFSGVETKRITFDPNNLRTPSNSFGDADTGCTLGGTQYAFDSESFFFGPGLPGFDSLDLPVLCPSVQGCMLMARVKFHYNENEDHSLGAGIDNIFWSTQLSPQGATISSTGNAGDSTRQIDVYQGFGEVPSIFESAVFSHQDIVK